MEEPRARRLYPVLVAACGVLLFLPGLTSFGLWDPYEIRVADAARGLLQNGLGTAPQLGRPPLVVWLVAAGFKLLGVGELGGRLPIALTALCAVLATYYLGTAFVSRRGALFGALLLAVSPGFLMGARQLTTDAPMVLGAMLAVGGLYRALVPNAGASVARRLIDLLLGLAGLAIGQLTLGFLVGVLAPMLALTIALAAATGRSSATPPVLPYLAGALVLGGIAFAAREWQHTTAYSPVLGGTPHALAHATVTTTHLVRIGFKLFPWIALVPVALWRAFDDEGDARARLGQVALVGWALATYLAGTAQSAAVVDVALPVAPALALLVGAYADEALGDARLRPFSGLVVTLGAIVLGRDFFVSPEQLASMHLLESVRWPGPLTHVPYVALAFAAFFAGVVGLGLGAPLAPANADRSDDKRRRGRTLLLGAGGAALLAWALAVDFWLVPQVSKHLSARDLYGKTARLDPNAPVGQYRFTGTGAAYYTGGKQPQTLATAEDLFKFLGRTERVFVLAGAEELPSIDQLARQRKIPYYVVDDSNSRYITLSNQLKADEKDANPLRLFVSEKPPKPQFPLEANFEDKVQLLGYDLPQRVGRGQDFKIRLYYKVLAPLGGFYKVFIHMDGPGARMNGDHIPLQGKFPTPNWVPGIYVTDEHKMTPDRAMQPAGTYRVFMGFFAGAHRLKVVSGPQDGENRVKLGAIVVK